MNDGKEKAPAMEFEQAVKQAWKLPEVPETLDRVILVQAQARANYFRLRRVRSPQWRLAACAVLLVGLCAGWGMYWSWHRSDAVMVAVSDPMVDEMVNMAAEAQARVAEQPRSSRKTLSGNYTWDDFDNKLLDLESDVAMARSTEIRANFNY